MGRLTISTPVGDGWVDLDVVKGAHKLLLIGHGAGGGVDAPDIKAVRHACLELGISVGRVTQPYRVAGRKTPPSSANLDAAWASIVTNLAQRRTLHGMDFVFAGRSSGARVACRGASNPDLVPHPVAVVALAFPEHPPGQPEKSRLEELDAVPVPLLLVQGDSDAFGMPPDSPARTKVVVPGDHSLKRSASMVGLAVANWLLALN